MTMIDVPMIGAELRRWRENRTLSQLALASRADVSTRHLSYVETGKSQPTPQMILRLADALDVPMDEQNRLLLLGGFAPRHPASDLDHENLSSVMASLRDLLDAHDPYPALLLDDQWNIVDANRAADALLVGCDSDLLEPPVNVLRLALHHRGMAPRIRNLATWRAHLLHQLAQRIRRRGDDPQLHALQDEVSAYPGGAGSAGRPVDPAVLLELDTDGGPLRFFSVATRIEEPNDVTLDALHLETFLPADEETRRRLG
ncbi:MAG: helix-turn-helix transcriptional regulator [Microbacterium sp.]|jgi:transcriptional regulator with XRE-family HTH domain|nr:helix-turn-helix transcriptional regulator [Microbacterium sp.]